MTVTGSGEDNGKWIRCWNCGFINSLDRVTVGDGEGITYSSSYVPYGYFETPEVSGASTMADGGLDTSDEIVMMGKLAYGSESVAGCAFCGCKNL